MAFSCPFFFFFFFFNDTATTEIYTLSLHDALPIYYNNGWLAGVTLGKARGAGTWQLGYQYEDLEADAALGLVSDSDFAGGGTDGKGSRLSGAYGINKQWNVGFTWFIDNKAGEKAFKDEGGALEYDRVMLDTVFKY